jgi:putative DNA primase/helicase
MSITDSPMPAAATERLAADDGIGAPKVHVTFFEDFKAKIRTTDTLTLAELCERVLNASARQKGKLPWLKLASFGTDRSANGSLRHDANVTEITGCELDYDGEQISFADALTALNALRIHALIHASPSHSDAAPRWRILAPTSKPCPPLMRAKMVARINGYLKSQLGAATIASAESFTLSQAYFYGWVMNKPGLDHRAEVTGGSFIDLRDDLGVFEASGGSANKADAGSHAGNAGTSSSTKAKEKSLPTELLDLIRDGVPRGEDRSAAFHHAVKWLKELGWKPDDIVELLARYPSGVAYKYRFRLAQEVERSFNKPDRPKRNRFDADDDNPQDDEDQEEEDQDERDANAPAARHNLPVILNKPPISDLTTQAEQALIDAEVPFYRRGGDLVRPIIRTVLASDDQMTNSAQLKLVSPVYMRDMICRHSIWKRWNAKEQRWVRANPPKDVAETLLHRDGDWQFREIVGVITTPTMRPDGTLLLRQGYDRATGLLLIEPPPMPRIADRPARDEALAALALLEELVQETPFVNDVAKSVGLSGIITPVVRGAFKTAPLHAASAPVAGTGKSFLWDIANAISAGQRRMPVIAAGRDEAETEKRLAAQLMNGTPLFSIDNVNGELGGDFLCQAVEQHVLELRVLGLSKIVRVEAGGFTIYTSGNNLQVCGDLCRRAITSRLDPRMERPHMRQFKQNPIDKILADRGKYIAACLTICRAYIVAGRPNRADRLASFEGWSDLVRSALIWLGRADCVASMELIHSEDPERAVLAEVLQCWVEETGVGHYHRTTLASLVETASEKLSNGGFGDELKHPELNAALRSAVSQINGGGSKLDATTLGRWCRKYRERIVGGFFLTKNQPSDNSVSTWWIEEVK